MPSSLSRFTDATSQPGGYDLPLPQPSDDAAVQGQKDNYGGMPRETFLGISPGRETAMAQNTLEILVLGAAGLTPETREPLRQRLTLPVAWEYLIDLAIFHGTAPRLFRNLVEGGLQRMAPSFQFGTLGRIYDYHERLNRSRYQELLKLFQAFHSRTIKFICLRGLMIDVLLYGEPSFSPSPVTEILLSHDDLDAAGAILTELGYERLPPASSCAEAGKLRFRKKWPCRLRVELSVNADRLNPRILPWPDIWPRHHTLVLGNDRLGVLSPEDALLYTAGFLRRRDRYWLKNLADIAAMVKKYRETLDWDYVLVPARKWGMSTCLHYALKAAGELFAAHVPPAVLPATAPGRWRRRVLDYLNSREAFLSPITNERLKKHISILTSSLMNDSPAMMLRALRQLNDSGKSLNWLQTALWTIPVFISAITGKNPMPDIIFSQQLGKMLRHQRLRRIIHYLADIHDSVTGDQEITICGKKFVFGPGVFSPRGTHASEFLARHLVVRPEDTVLDMGTGIGIQAIVAADLASRVVATDINPQAIFYARENARRNGCQHKLVLKVGDLFEPVGGDRFDLIVWNAPYLPLESHSVMEMSWCSGKNQKLIARFLKEARTRLTAQGKIQILFSSIGDLSWLMHQAEEHAYTVNIVATMSAGWEHLVILLLVPA